MPTVRAVIQTVEPGTRVDNVAMLDAIVARATAQPRFATRVVAGFGLVALLVAAVGIYGTLSYVVASRRREIGIRLALGAPRQRIVSTLLWRGALPATIGAIVGTLGAALFARTFNALFFQVAALDGLSMAGGALVVLLAGIAASVIPSMRAGRIDPIVALRAD